MRVGDILPYYRTAVYPAHGRRQARRGLWAVLPCHVSTIVQAVYRVNGFSYLFYIDDYTFLPTRAYKVWVVPARKFQLFKTFLTDYNTKTT